MNKYIQRNFESFKQDFELNFQESIPTWISKNLCIKKNKNSKELDLSDDFISHALLKNPPQDWLQSCDELFSKTRNLNGRTTHLYLSNQVHGTLKEALHARKLAKKHPNFDVNVVSCEFNSETKKREIYLNVSRANRKPDLNVSWPKHDNLNAGNADIHVKSNDYFLDKKQITFRGGKNSEYKQIKEKEYVLHILVNHKQYLSISDFNNLKDHISTNQVLTGKEAQSWGGQGAKRICFKNSIEQLLKRY
jgi:hypothetical protein